VIGGANLAQQQSESGESVCSANEFINRYPAGLSLDQFVDAILLTIITISE